VALTALGRPLLPIFMAFFTQIVCRLLIEAFDLPRPLFMALFAIIGYGLVFFVVKGNVAIFCWQADGVSSQSECGADHGENNCGDDFFHGLSPFLRVVLDYELQSVCAKNSRLKQ
jgi:hypothetical protein